MKKTGLLLMGVGLIVAVSFLYKYSKAPFLSGFPAPGRALASSSDGVLFLYVFFSKATCPPCLEFFEVLNRIGDQFPVVGIIPEKDYPEKDLVARTTGARFPIESAKNYRRFMPPYNPSLFGVTGKGRILFVVPGVAGEAGYLEAFLAEFKRKAHILLTES
jgi:hypothetical protein